MIGSIGVLLLLVLPANATHIGSPATDLPILRPPMAGEGYLNFVEIGPTPPGGCPSAPVGGLLVIPCSEEYTGWTGLPIPATGDTNDFPTDNGLTHGDRADFDWVVENRLVETGAFPFPAVNHPGVVGQLTWEIGPTTPSAHINPFTGAVHAHVGLLPVCADGSRNLCDPDYAGTVFDTADVFSVISLEPSTDFPGALPGFNLLVTDIDISPREAALDYLIEFCSVITGLCVTPSLVAVFAPGWHAAATSDDFIARWTIGPAEIALLGGGATHVLIEPAFPGPDQSHPDQITQIDAIKVARRVVPLPPAFFLFVTGLATAAAWGAWRRF